MLPYEDAHILSVAQLQELTACRVWPPVSTSGTDGRLAFAACSLDGSYVAVSGERMRDKGKGRVSLRGKEGRGEGWTERGEIGEEEAEVELAKVEGGVEGGVGVAEESAVTFDDCNPATVRFRASARGAA